ncbi:MAG: sugar 3,4-ketoisomerase [Oceanihabitans sp.]
MKIDQVKIIDIPKITDVRGNISVVENDTIPFKIKRVFYLYDVPSGMYRGAHAHKELQQFIIAVSGSFDVILKDRFGGEKRVTLKRPDKGLLVPNMIWSELDDFSSGAVSLVMASNEYIEADYIRDFDTFLNTK